MTRREGESKVRLIKMLGIAVVAALASMAFIGAGTASAKMTALCSAAPELVGGALHCKAGTKLTGTVTVTGTNVGNPKLLAGSSTVECETSTFSANLNTESGASKELVLGPTTSLTFSKNCKITGVPCTVTSVTANTPFETHVEYLGDQEPAGLVILLKPNTTLLLNCFLVGDVKCVYAANENVHGELFNATGHLTVAAKVTTASGGLCPKEGTQDGLYKVLANGKQAWVALL